MANLFRSAHLNRLCLYGTLATFTLGTIPQVHAYSPSGYNCAVNLNDIGFAIRVEKLIEKANKYKDRRDSSKLLDVMVDLKNEVEAYTGKKIDLDKQLDKVEKQMKDGGAKYSSSEMKKIRKSIKSKEKRSNHKALYMAECMELGIDYSADMEAMVYMAKHGKDKEEEPTIEMPLRVTVGVTIALCGLFLCFIPIPVCQAWGPSMVQGGIALAVEGTINRVEEDKKKESK